MPKKRFRKPGKPLPTILEYPGLADESRYGPAYNGSSSRAKMLPTTEMVGISAKALGAIFSCVRCDNLPSPDDACGVCVKGHYTCGNCLRRCRKLKSSNAVGSCCQVGNLTPPTPESSSLLKILLSNALFMCPYHENGCTETMLGSKKFQEHSINCKLATFYKCRYHNCKQKRVSLIDYLEHYMFTHKATMLVLTHRDSCVLGMNFKETIQQRCCVLLNVKGSHFIFAVQVNGKFIFSWVWSLEHKACHGKKANIKYCLRFKRARENPGMEKETERVKIYNSECLSHLTEPEEIIFPSSNCCASAFKLDLEMFKKMFVADTVDGHGKWTIRITVFVKEAEKEGI